ncbi:hypothetical protein PENSPDRAFT_753174 [Peniophora sp. CONT]|nr:hypothetical protein PENSPDRAFT_753174 [Peniophora sp. CONT]
MLVPRGPEAGKEELVACLHCRSMARFGYDERGYTVFKDKSDTQFPSRGQVWSIRASLMLPIGELLEKEDLKQVHHNETSSSKSRPMTIRTWLNELKTKGCKGPRPCIIYRASRGSDSRAWLMGTFNDGHFVNLPLCVDMFFVQVDPPPADMTPSEQHVHAAPRWCETKKQYVCVLMTQNEGLLPDGHEEKQRYLLKRWTEKHGTPAENGQHYGFSDHQINRLQTLGHARGAQWRNLDKKTKMNTVKDFRRFVTRHSLEYGADDLPVGQPGGSLRSRFTPSSRTKRTFGGYFGNNLFTHTEDVPSDSTSHHAHPMASPTRRSFADGRRSSRASVRH